ncbi:hypothetical protein D3C81_1896880 [compost metagenome]
MAKPDWNDAPEWANWLGQDEVGTHQDHFWVWFENKPKTMSNGWIDHSAEGRWLETRDVATTQDWRNTLEQRP